MMSQPGQGGGRRDSPVTAQILEERINVYISAMDRALSMNDTSMSSQLQRDIQQLVDLMEKVQSGHAVTEKDVPPPLVMTPLNDVLANPLGELSSRLSDYHKALYFAEEELSEGRINKIQALQKGLQTIHTLQKRAQAGFPIREDEVPPPVTIPSDSEFDNNAVKTITERLEQYNAVLKISKDSSSADRRRIPKIESGIRTLEFLLTRAKANRPVWRKDIPPEFEYFAVNPDSVKLNKAKMNIQVQSLITRVSKVRCGRPEQQNVAEELNQKLKSLVESLLSSSSPQKIDVQSLVHQVEALEMMSDHESKNDEGKEITMTQNQKDDLTLIETRIKEYSTAALRAKKEGHVKTAIEHLKVVKGLNPMKETLEKGSSVDMTLVPPPPKDEPHVESPSPVSSSPEPSRASTAHAQLTDTNTETATAHAQLTGVIQEAASAHAQVTDINTKPAAVETNKSKLARKLAHYLEVDSEVVSLDSTSSSSFDSDSISSPQEETVSHMPVSELCSSPRLDPPPKSHSNSDNKTPNEPVPHKLSLSNIGFVSCENGSGTEGISAAVNPDRTKAVSNSEIISSMTSKNHEGLNSSPARALRGSINSVIDTKGAEDHSLIKAATSGDNKYAVINREPQMQPTTSMLPRTNERSGSKKESNSSGHLDSIGFLSCQDVPSFPTASTSDQKSNLLSENTPSDLQKDLQEPQGVLPSFEISNSMTKFPALTKSNGESMENTEAKSESVPNSGVESGSDHFGAGLQPQECSTLTSNNVVGEELSIGQAHTLLSAQSVCNQNTQSTSNQSDSIQTTLSYHEVNGHEDTSQVPSITNVSSHTKSPEVTNLHSEMKVSNNSSTFDPSSEPVSAGNQNPNVNGLLVDSSKENSSENNTGKAFTTDAEEFEDLMNSMSLPPTTGEETLNPLNKDEGSVMHPPVNNEQVYQKNENNSGTSNGKEILTAEKTFTSLPYQSNTLNNEQPNLNPVDTLEPTFHSLPANFPVPASTQKSSQPLSDLNGTSNAAIPPVSNALPASGFSLDTSIPSSSQLSVGTLPDTPSSLNSSSAHLPLGSFMKGTDSFTETNGGLVPASSVNSNSSPFTCLETLKYDILIAEAKNSTESNLEAEQLGRDLEAIKEKLRNGKRKVWEEYKNRVEYELQVLNIGVKQCQETQNWEEYKYLNSKRMLNERELALLNQRLHEIQE